ncbi:hypothetical protein SK128_020612 [Halocaridina rubra]|uniref:Uncharacterized protein n=1 Tax=Halocaridina rubra TaxID=373956 RepID=A0AAN9A6H5_HALRR
MANIEQKMNEVMRGVQVAEDYLDYLRARINKAQDRASFCHVESQKMNGEASDLEVELKPLRAECAQLTAELLTQEMQLESVNEEIHKAEDLLKTAESLVDDTCFKDIVDNVMKATLIFREKVRIANPAILAHELSLRKTLQSFTLEETTLRCEIRVLEEKQCTVRSGNTDNNMLQVFNMQQKKRELHHLLDTEKQIRQELIDSCNKMIVQDFPTINIRVKTILQAAKKVDGEVSAYTIKEDVKNKISQILTNYDIVEMQNVHRVKSDEGQYRSVLKKL